MNRALQTKVIYTKLLELVEKYDIRADTAWCNEAAQECAAAIEHAEEVGIKSEDLEQAMSDARDIQVDLGLVLREASAYEYLGTVIAQVRDVIRSIDLGNESLNFKMTASSCMAVDSIDVTCRLTYGYSTVEVTGADITTIIPEFCRQAIYKKQSATKQLVG